jgi:RNA polymerase sigma-70 factor (family 1)
MKAISEGNDWFYLYREGDKNAFEKVFDLYYRSIVYYALKILHEDSYAEDIVSESFRKAWENRKKMETPRHLENFLYFVTRNACISYLRSDRTIQTTEKEWGRMTDLEEEDNVLDLERVQSELIQKIYAHLEKLPGGDILRMSYLEGKSTKEIATELNITENTVYIAKHRSLKALRAMLSHADWVLFLLLFAECSEPFLIPWR